MARAAQQLDLEAEVATLEGLDLEDLRKVWADRFGPPPKLRSVELLRLMLGWRIQARQLGGLDSELRRVIAKKGSPLPEGHHLGTGAILRRTWQGRQIDVEIGKDGFHYDGRCWKSLSAIAFEVTGTRWNGPRFFGLRTTGP